MKTIPILIAVLFLTGCSTLSNVGARFNCQDYANAWARDANSQGIVAGVIWYESNCTPGHAICWAVVNGDTVYIEPQTGARRRNPYTERGCKIITRVYGTTVGEKLRLR